MSTNANISIYNEETKELKVIYCHWDGYLEETGKKLSKFYTNKEKVEELIDEDAEDESENRRARKELKEWTREAKQGQLKNLEERKSPSKATTYSPVKAKGPSLFGFNTLDQILNRR